MRALNDHRLAGVEGETLNAALDVDVLDHPGSGGACAEYVIRHRGASNRVATGLVFQRGPVAERGVNGVTQEALLAVLIDRLRGFEGGPFPCEENAEALDHLEAALAALHRRTRDRLERDVEGTSAA